jgi:hypothetical protein
MNNPPAIPDRERSSGRRPLYHKQHFNVRGQLYDMRLSTQSWTQNPLD